MGRNLIILLSFAIVVSAANGSGLQATKPAAGVVEVSCATDVVEVDATNQCFAKVDGLPNTAVIWSVNGREGGSYLYGTITTTGLYRAPIKTPDAHNVIIRAFSKIDKERSGSTSIAIAKIINSSTQTISSVEGGTVSLEDGSYYAKFPPGVLRQDTVVTLQLTSVSVQPTNALFHGVGPSLHLSFASKSGKPITTGLTKATPTAKPSYIKFGLRFVEPQLSDAQARDSLGVLNVNDGEDNYFALQSISRTNESIVLQADTSMDEDPYFFEVGLTVLMGKAPEPGNVGWMEEWNKGTSTFSRIPSDYCLKGSRTLVLVHGMLSSPELAFAPTSGPSWASIASASYDTVIGFRYDWWKSIDGSASALASALNALFNPSRSTCRYDGTFDIEAHSEGTIVALTSAKGGRLSPGTIAKLKHVVLVAGPLDGTPIAQKSIVFLTLCLNIGVPRPWTVLVPSSVNELFPFIEQLKQRSQTIQDAQTSALCDLGNVKITAVAGDQKFSRGSAETWVYDQALMTGQPHDGVVPVRSALLSDFTYPNLERLKGNDPVPGDYPYPLDHIHLVNNPVVMQDVIGSLQQKRTAANVPAR